MRADPGIFFSREFGDKTAGLWIVLGFRPVKRQTETVVIVAGSRPRSIILKLARAAYFADRKPRPLATAAGSRFEFLHYAGRYHQHRV